MAGEPVIQIITNQSQVISRMEDQPIGILRRILVIYKVIVKKLKLLNLETLHDLFEDYIVSEKILFDSTLFPLISD